MQNIMSTQELCQGRDTVHENVNEIDIFNFQGENLVDSELSHNFVLCVHQEKLFCDENICLFVVPKWTISFTGCVQPSSQGIKNRMAQKFLHKTTNFQKIACVLFCKNLFYRKTFGHFQCSNKTISWQLLLKGHVSQFKNWWCRNFRTKRFQ